MRPFRAYLLSGLVAASWPALAHAQTITDELYNAHHPRLLFTSAELPALATKLSDGGIDDVTYADVLRVVQDVYPTNAFSDILGPLYGEFSIPCIGIVGHLEGDSDALALGKALTTHIADTYNADADEAHSGMRLRALAMGYDLFFENATPAERGYIRDEIVLYIQRMVWNVGYQVFEQQPYLGNHSAMFAAPLGLAAIVLQGETEDYLLTDAMAMADRIVDNLLRYQFDPVGAYNEGAFYAAWTLKQLVYYFDARHRFDGRSYTDNHQFRLIEEWLTYEISPEGLGRSHNLNDSPVLMPLVQHPTYFNWAMGAWNSGLSAWLWKHTAGNLGANVGGNTDWTSTILWHKTIQTVDPATVLPKNRVWEQRGLYCFRSGWPAGASSTDVVFNFYSGKYQGGHAQEDQNQFSLTAYGTAFAIDHGAGDIAKESEAHNLVLIDGLGQHNAGSSIGTDGVITDYVLGDFADIVCGDATAAYATYSEFNEPDVPVDGTNWSWGYIGANPVLFARRSVLLVHGTPQLPYAVVMDDIDKNGASHVYEWRLHTANTNTVNTTANPITVAGGNATMNLHLIAPNFSDVSVATAPFDNGNPDPDATVIRVTRTATNPKFTFLMLPRTNATAAPAVSRSSFSWGCGATITWGGGIQDLIVRNDSGTSKSYAGVSTNGAVAVVRKSGSTVQSYLMAKGQSLVISGTTYATISDAPGSCEFSGSIVRLDRYDADFRIRNTGVTQVLYHNQELGFMVDGSYVVPDGITGTGDPVPSATFSVSAHPNPFNPATTIRIDGLRNEQASVTIYDVAGRRVRELWSGIAATSRSLTWDGRNDDGASVASGTYFVRALTPSATRTLKLTMVK